jgi:hypothetical protein
MELESKRSVTVCAGLSGYGKNTFILRYLVNADLTARFIFDPDPGEFNPDQGEFSDRLKLEPTVTAYQLMLHLVRGWIVFDPHGLFLGRLKEAAEFFCDWAFQQSLALPGKKAIVLDEVWQYCTGQYIPDALQNVCVSGRKRGLKLIVATQQPQRLNMTMKTCVSEIVCFRLQGDGPLSFAEEFGFNRDEVATLEPLAFVARNLDSGGELRGRIEP